MNPPYGRGLVNRATGKFLEEYYKGTFSRAVVLVNNATETKWFQALLRESAAYCFTDHRIAFETPDNKQVSNNTRGQAFLLFESDLRRRAVMFARFKQQFGKFGFVGAPL